MTSINMLNSKLVGVISKYLFFIVCLCFVGCTQKTSTFRSTALTAEDVIEIYKIDVKRRPVEKFEWSFTEEQYVRYIVEVSKDSGKSWSVDHVMGNKMKCKAMTFMFMVEHTVQGSNGCWTYVTQLGGVSESVSWKVGGSFTLPINYVNTTTTIKRGSPEELYLVQTNTDWYRLRLEHSSRMFK